MTSKNVVIGSGVDWITITSTEKDLSFELQQWFNTEEERYRDSELLPHPWAAMGYRGTQIGAIKFGIRGLEEAIAIISGDSTDVLCRTIPVAGLNVTRIDLQVTVSLRKARPGLARELYAKMLEEKLDNPQCPSVQLISGVSGDTLYVGTRGGKPFLRIYDKGWSYNETKLGQIWRFEVEYRREQAKLAFARWLAAEDKTTYTIAQVLAEVKKKGIRPRFSSKSEIDAIETKAVAKTVAGQLEWLEKCVSPVLIKLANLGYEEEVISALKLRHLIRRSDQWQ